MIACCRQPWPELRSPGGIGRTSGPELIRRHAGPGEHRRLDLTDDEKLKGSSLLIVVGVEHRRPSAPFGLPQQTPGHAALVPLAHRHHRLVDYELDQVTRQPTDEQLESTF